MSSEGFVIPYSSVVFWVQVCITLSLLGLVYLVIRLELFCPTDAECVIINSENTKTLWQKVDKLHEIAVFPTHVIRWHTLYVTCVIGGLLSVCLWNLVKPENYLWQFLVIMFPTFAVGQCFFNFMSFHSPARDHAKSATTLRMDIEREIYRLEK